MKKNYLKLVIQAVFIVWMMSAFALSIDAKESLTVAVIGDYGNRSDNQQYVVDLIDSWNPDLVLTVGDNVYPNGEEAKFDETVGQYFAHYMGSYAPKEWKADAYYHDQAGANCLIACNCFFPTLGNHDVDVNKDYASYLKYFELPGQCFENDSGNERYYRFKIQNVEFFAMNFDGNEPHGRTVNSRQAKWLKKSLKKSSADFKIVIGHQSPLTSDSRHGSVAAVDWPFQLWGADALLTGHSHVYERVVKNGFPYFVNGLGGKSLYRFGQPIEGSEVRYANDYGAMRIVIDSTKAIFEFIDVKGSVIDVFAVEKKERIPQKSFPMMPVVAGMIFISFLLMYKLRQNKKGRNP